MSSDGLHKDLLNRICTNLAELNRQLDRHDLNQALQHAEAIHAHENQEQFQRGQRSRLHQLEDQITLTLGMVGELMAQRQPMIKLIHNGMSQWVTRADIIRACVTPYRTFILWLRETGNSGESYGLTFDLNDPQVSRIQAFLDHMCLDLNAGDTQPL